MSVVKALTPEEWAHLSSLYKWAVQIYKTFYRVEAYIRHRGIKRSRYQVVTDLDRLYQQTGKFAYARCSDEMKRVSDEVAGVPGYHTGRVKR